MNNSEYVYIEFRIKCNYSIEIILAKNMYEYPRKMCSLKCVLYTRIIQ